MTLVSVFSEYSDILWIRLAKALFRERFGKVGDRQLWVFQSAISKGWPLDDKIWNDQDIEKGFGTHVRFRGVYIRIYIYAPSNTYISHASQQSSTKNQQRTGQSRVVILPEDGTTSVSCSVQPIHLAVHAGNLRGWEPGHKEWRVPVGGGESWRKHGRVYLLNTPSACSTEDYGCISN